MQSRKSAKDACATLNYRGTDFLMTPDNPNKAPEPCRLSRNDWNIINFVQNSPITSKEK
jgi:hypothetical protein